MALEDLDGYKEAVAERDAALAVAERTGDEVTKLRAELDWTKKERGFNERWAAQQATETRLNDVREQIKKDYPMVPTSLLQHIGDPEALLNVAKDMAKSLDKSVNSWGKPGGTSGGGSSSDEEVGGGYTKHEIDELVKRVNTGNPAAIKEYKSWVMKTRVFPFAKVDQTQNSRSAR